MARSYKRYDKFKGKGLKYLTRQQLLKKQDNGCGICLRPLTYKAGIVDHDHKTDIIRGVLCISCNNRVGAYENGKFKFMESFLGYDYTKVKEWITKDRGIIKPHKRRKQKEDGMGIVDFLIKPKENCDDMSELMRNI